MTSAHDDESLLSNFISQNETFYIAQSVFIRFLLDQTSKNHDMLSYRRAKDLKFSTDAPYN